MSVDALIVLGFAAVIVVIAALAWLLKKQTNDALRAALEPLIDAQKQDVSAQFLQREVAGLRDQLAKSLQESARLVSDSQKTVGERLDRAAAVVGQVQRSLGALEQATQQVHAVGKDIAQLQEILRAPKLRGSLGELFLGDLLAQILPPRHFTLQHAFRSGEIVDAVVRIGRLVPVDAKFPLENFRRVIQTEDPAEKAAARRKFIADVKKHVDAIASKYILPDEGTFDFALMYIPAENVYYETVVKDETAGEDASLVAYAFSKRVVPVSPNSFYAYLHTISLGLRGLQVEENARLIIEQLARLRGDFARFRDDFAKLGGHLGNARSKFEDAEKRLSRFEDKLGAVESSKESGAALPLDTAS